MVAKSEVDRHRFLQKISPFDIIIMLHVLEHIRCAREYPLDLLEYQLRPGGRLFLAQTAHTVFLPATLPILSYGCQLQEHNYHFAPRTFEHLLRDSGKYEVACVVKYQLIQDFSFSVKGAVKLVLDSLNYRVPYERYDAFMLGIRNRKP